MVDRGYLARHTRVLGNDRPWTTKSYYQPRICGSPRIPDKHDPGCLLSAIVFYRRNVAQRIPPCLWRGKRRRLFAIRKAGAAAPQGTGLDSLIVRRSHIHNSKYESHQAAVTNKFTRFPRSAPISRARSGDSVPDSDAQRSRSRPRFRPQLSFGVD